MREAAGQEAAPYVHWGATTQDIVDTATVLQIRCVLGILENRLSTLIACLADFAERHRTTVMAGRTHGQQALPISFGLKAAGWLAPFLRHRKRLDAQRNGLLQLQFGGSSSMPQKRNPIVSELIIAAARTNASLLSAMHHAMIQEHERATHGWQVEWLTLSQMIVLTGGALKNVLFLAKKLKVNKAVMRANLARSNDLVLAEAAVLALSAEISRTEAHALVKQACGVAAAENRSLIDVVKQQFGQTAPQNKIDWEALGRPENYLGQTRGFIDRVLAQAGKYKT